MWFFILVLIVAFLAGIVGIIEEIGPLVGPSLVIAAIITAITLFIAHKNKRK